jgi:hypothetical protein
MGSKGRQQQIKAEKYFQQEYDKQCLRNTYIYFEAQRQKGF